MVGVARVLTPQKTDESVAAKIRFLVARRRISRKLVIRYPTWGDAPAPWAEEVRHEAWQGY